MELKLYVNGSKQELLDTRSVLNAAMKTDQSTSSWAGKANSFHYLRGTTPSYGYFLVHGSGASLTGDSITNPFLEQEVEVEVDCGSELLKITGLQIESSMAVLKGGKTTNSVFLVKVIDPIISNISKNSITKEYNVPIGLKYPKSFSLASSKQGSEEEISYDKTTLKEGKEPYTWSEIFTDILKGGGEEEPEIDFEDADFPEGIPQGIRLLHGSSKELLDDLLGKLGLTIIRSRTGSLKISVIDSSKVEGTIDSFSENRLNINKFPKTDTQFTNIPSKVVFRFPKVALKNDLGTLYDKVESKTPIVGKYSPIPDTEWSVELPYYSEGTSKEDQEGSSEKGKPKKGSRKKITETLMRHYDGIWRARTKEYQEAIFYSYLPIDIDKGISEVRWSFTDKEGPKTKISSFPGNEFPENSKETFPREFIGLGVVDKIDSELDTFSVKKINIISGEYKEINDSSASISEVKELFTSQSIHKGDEVILIRNTSSGKIFAFKPGAPPKVEEFALVDKLKLEDARTRAVLVDDYGLPNYSAANSSQKELGITFAQEIYVFDSENERVGRPGEGRYTPVPDKQWSDDLRTTAIQLGVEKESPRLAPKYSREEFDDYNNRPYKGYAKLITQNTKAFLKNLVPEDVWKDVLPIPGYEIVEMDAPARFLVVEFIKDESKGSASLSSSKQGSNISAHPRSGLKANILTDTIGTGLPTQGREPPDSFGSKGSSSLASSKQEETSSYQLKVWSGPTYDGLDVKAGDIRWVYYNDVKDRYEFFIHDHENIVLIRCSDKLKVIVQNIKISEKKGFLSDHIGKVVRLEEDALLEEDCWTIAGVSDCSSGICPTVLDVMDECDECDGCYKLSDCDSDDTKIIKKTEIGKDEDGKAIVIGDGDIVRLDDGTCWTVSLTEYCESTETVTIKSHATSCTLCDWCYELTRCSNSEETKKIHEDAHEFEIGDVFKINGTCWEVTNEGECASIEGTAEHISTPTQTYDGCEECGCYKLSPCEDTEGGDLYIDKDDGGMDLHLLVGKVIRTATGGCYTVSESQDCDKLTAVTIQEEFYACGNPDSLDGPQQAQACVAYEITRCDDDEGSDYAAQCTYSDLSSLQGKVVRRAEDQKCYTVGSVVSWSASCIEVTEEEAFEECLDCTDPKYQLTQCSGCESGSSTKITDEDLAEAVGQIIKVDGICYSVSKLPNDATVDLPAPLDYSEEDDTYTSCKACNPEEMWVVTNVYEDGNQLKQDRKKVIVQQVCDEETVDIIDIGDCDD